MRTVLITVALAAPLACAACSSGSGTPGPTVYRTVTRTVTAQATPSSDTEPSGLGAQTLPDPCKLLPLADATALAGTKLDPPDQSQSGAANGNTACQYVGPTSGPEAQVTVFVGDGAKQQLHVDKDNLHHTFTSISGIGDECDQEDNAVWVHKNGLWASIILVRLNDAASNAKRVTAAARILAANMP